MHTLYTLQHFPLALYAVSNYYYGELFILYHLEIRPDFLGGHKRCRNLSLTGNADTYGYKLMSVTETPYATTHGFIFFTFTAL